MNWLSLAALAAALLIMHVRDEASSMDRIWAFVVDLLKGALHLSEDRTTPFENTGRESIELCISTMCTGGKSTKLGITHGYQWVSERFMSFLLLRHGMYLPPEWVSISNPW